MCYIHKLMLNEFLSKCDILTCNQHVILSQSVFFNKIRNTSNSNYKEIKTKNQQSGKEQKLYDVIKKEKKMEMKLH